MESHAKSFMRNTKNIMYTPIQAQVRTATSNQPFGPTSTQMQEIAKLTYNTNDMCEVMDMIDKRLSDSGKNWRHVYKVTFKPNLNNHKKSTKRGNWG
jgi:epsin